MASNVQHQSLVLRRSNATILAIANARSKIRLDRRKCLHELVAAAGERLSLTKPSTPIQEALQIGLGHNNHQPRRLSKSEAKDYLSEILLLHPHPQQRCIHDNVPLHPNSNVPTAESPSVHGSASQTMPPHLHPRSTATSTLFAGTLLASFTVVAIPHIFPCPRPRRAYADVERQVQLDSEGRPGRRKRRKSDVEAPQENPPALAGGVPQAPSTAEPKPKDLLHIADEAAIFRHFQAEAEMLEKEAHECPVPKPGGVLGRLLGFQQDGKAKKDTVRERSRDSQVTR